MQKFLLFFILSSTLWAMSLEEVLSQVEKENFELQQSLIHQEIASLKHQEAKRSRFGAIKLGGGYTQYDSPRTLAPMTPPVNPNTPKDKKILNANVSYGLTLFDGFGIEHSIAIEEIGAKMASFETIQTKWSLKRNAIALYVAGLALQETLLVQKEYVKALSLLESIVKEEEKLGKRALVDVLQISTERTEAFTNELSTKSELLHIKLELARLMNIDNKHFIFKPIQDLVVPMSENSSIEKTSLIQLANLNIERAEKAYQKTKSSFSPKFTLETNYSRSYGDNTHENTYQAGIGVEWIVFDFGLRSKRLEQARLERIKTLYEKKDIHEKLTTAIAQAQLKISKTQEEYALMTKKSTLATHVENIESKKLEEGVITMQSYLLHAADAHFAKVQEYNALYALIDAKHQYLTLLEIER